MVSLPMATRECGECRECCIAFPLLADEQYWPEGKPAHQPCKHLCASGCAIHNQPRPEVCTEYRCDYLKGYIPYRPNECGVIMSGTQYEQEVARQNGFNIGFGIALFETRLEAVLQLESSKIRYYLRKNKRHYDYASVMPYTVDSSYSALGEKRLRNFGNLLVWYQD